MHAALKPLLANLNLRLLKDLFKGLFISIRQSPNFFLTLDNVRQSIYKVNEPVKPKLLAFLLEHIPINGLPTKHYPISYVLQKEFSVKEVAQRVFHK